MLECVLSFRHMADRHLPASHVQLPKRSAERNRRRSVLALALLTALRRQHTAIATFTATFSRYR